MAYDLTTVTNGGTPSLTAGAAKFGSAGLQGTGGYGIGNSTQTNQPDSFLQTGSLIATGSTGGTLTTGTIEFWMKRNGAPGGTEVMVGHDGWYWIGLAAANHVTLHYGGGNSTELVLNTSVNVCDNAFHHIAVVFNSGAPTIWIDGSSAGSSASTQGAGASAAGFIVGGGFGTLATFNFAGQIDEVCVSNIAQYSTSFTPSAVAFSNTRTGAIALYHFDGTTSDSAAAAIASNDGNIVYSPFTWDISSSRAKTINPGAYFRLEVTGSTPSSLALNFDVSADLTPLPQIWWRLDGGAWTATPLTSTVSMTVIQTAWSSHLVEVIVKSETETQARWSTQSTNVSFTGLSAPAGSTTVPIQVAGLNVLCYGDSITEGVRTLNSTAANDTDRNDAARGWAWSLTKSLGAEVGVVGFGGSGLSVTGSGGVPILGTSYSLLWGSGPSRSFSSPVPDAIIINDGTNDGTTDITSAYTTVLNALLAATPSTTVILAIRPFNGNAASFIQAAVAACNTPSRVFYVDTTGWLAAGDTSDGIHPYGYVNMASITQRIAAAVRSAFAGRGPLFINNAGNPVSVSPYRG